MLALVRVLGLTMLFIFVFVSILISIFEFGFGSILEQNLAKTMEGTKINQSFGVLSCQATQCSNTFFFGTLHRFGTKTLVFLGLLSRITELQIFRTHGLIDVFGTSQCFGSILEQNPANTMEGLKKTKVLVPKRWRVPPPKKRAKLWSIG